MKMMLKHEHIKKIFYYFPARMEFRGLSIGMCMRILLSELIHHICFEIHVKWLNQSFYIDIYGRIYKSWMEKDKNLIERQISIVIVWMKSIQFKQYQKWDVFHKTISNTIEMNILFVRWNFC